MGSPIALIHSCQTERSLTMSADLDRFIQAQEDSYAAALTELEQGSKQTHWMWFIFPQLKGLGRSSTAQFYALADRAEARAFLEHPILGERMRTCTRAILCHARTRTAHEILGSPDDLKFRSCMTLFSAVAPDEAIWRNALDAFFGGKADPLTLELLGKSADA
jgi:uncharacterized protein (DUF1810 family)